jgi:hypothetical protein
MDLFALTKEQTMNYNSILVAIGALLSCAIFCLLPYFAKKIKEIDILIWGGLLIMCVGKFVYIPFRSELPVLKFLPNETWVNGTGFNLTTDIMFNATTLNATYGIDVSLAYNATLKNETEEIVGCPVATQPWCAWTPGLGIPEYIVGYFFGVIGQVSLVFFLTVIA